jgi:hypothetical protein
MGMRFVFKVALPTLLVFVTASASAQPPVLAVDDTQRVTVTGSFDSLRAAVVELCRGAGVELRAYEAEDRPFAASYENIPLSDALARLLRSEIYLAGLRPGEADGGAIVSWLRVSGSKGGVVGQLDAEIATRAPAAVTLKPGIESIELGVAPKIVETALTSSDTAARNTARRRILETLSEDQASLQRYVSRDVTVVVDELAPFPHAVELVSVLQNVTREVDERNQLQEILRALRLRRLELEDGDAIAQPTSGTGTPFARK